MGVLPARTVASFRHFQTTEFNLRSRARHMHYYGAKQLANAWRTVRRNTIQIAEEIPAEQYGFRATEDTMPVGELLAHMATAPLWAVSIIFEEKKENVVAE